MSKPTKQQASDALAALHQVASDESAPPYARATAARSIIGAGGKRRRRRAAKDKGAPDGPQTLVILPDNGRDPHLVKLDVVDPQTGIVITSDPDTFRNQPALPAPAVALPAPPVKSTPMTAAERQRRRRARLTAEREAAATL